MTNLQETEMSPSKLIDGSDDFARRGTEIYDRDVRPALRPEDEGKFVAIDIESGSYELAEDDYVATEHLLKRRPQARIWLARAGQPAAYRVGGRTAVGEAK
jgi:hypothetical protein